MGHSVVYWNRATEGEEQLIGQLVDLAIGKCQLTDRRIDESTSTEVE
jgi:hypothetical protein